MKKLTLILALFLTLAACNNSDKPADSGSTGDQENFISIQQNGKWTTDFETAQELKGMHYTIENFSLLNKKKFENLKAYQEFGNLMQMHIDRTTATCKLDRERKNLLCSKLDKIKAEVETLHGDDMVKSKEALKNINTYLAEIDSSFTYMN